MLGVDQAATLLDGLKPPPGMEIDAAVGTTFTLDLTALLSIPVAATLASDEQSEDSADLLETIRRYADRTVLFCQAGAIAVPPRYRAALTFVEQTVVEVSRPPGGIFHPKVWVVRFTGRGTYRHRVLVMSRNLTFDRSWDVVVRLDEDPEAARTMKSAGMVEFLRTLPAQASRAMPRTQVDLVDSLATTLEKARLEVPTPFESGAFVPLSGRRSGVPFRRRCDHALAISPFLSEGAARSFIDTATAWAGVISRPSALDSVADGIRHADRVLRLKDAVLDAERTIDDTFDTAEANPNEVPHLLRGLHAKVYLQDHDDQSTAWLGSANLTAGAFATNVEMLVRLTGPVTRVGIDALLSPTPKRNSLAWFVEYHDLPEESAEPQPEEGLSEVEGHALDLASCDTTVTLTEGDEDWDATLTMSPWTVPDGLTVKAKLLSLENDPPTLVIDGATHWSAIPRALITPFVVLEVHAAAAVRRTVVRAHLIGDPEDRRRHVIANAIASRDDFMRYLAALLGVDLGFGFGGAGDVPFGASWSGGLGSSRVLEDLLLTASREPARLASLDDTLKQLASRPEVAEIVPGDFHPLWEAVYSARRQAIR